MLSSFVFSAIFSSSFTMILSGTLSSSENVEKRVNGTGPEKVGCHQVASTLSRGHFSPGYYKHWHHWACDTWEISFGGSHVWRP
ncbi:hypothetical protein KI387_014576, partial [Taxus chinensis]